jgi:hypothetical protein
MFVDILARDAIDSLSRLRAARIHERTAQSLSDADDIIGHDPSPERERDSTG